MAVLREVHDADGYPLTWPADPARWLTPAGLLDAWVAMDGHGAILGHVLLARTEQAAGPVAEVGRLFVAPQARRQAVGRRLVEHALIVADDQRMPLVLEVVDGDSAASAMYEATGWRLTHISTADWTGPNGEAVRLRHYRSPIGSADA
ncbi:hypothetical protein GCM10011608_28630 [Micromonospora sonchi]|uniref:N-acetyltransferase domain-containing protein n=1 Tax=Micromonospora sonchi TaxID=1763543 RepID=A0A917TX20_9ACTN|nr:hypothetical protein GCM10011608_28630 [Micromonospora sonchi]